MDVLAFSTWLVLLTLVLAGLLFAFPGLRLFSSRRNTAPGTRRHSPVEDRQSLIESIELLLPQTQCGQCGFAGCAPYAESIARGDAINKCPPGGDSTIRRLASLMQLPVVPLDPQHGAITAPSVAFIREAECIGCTKCIQACPVDAILGAAKLMHTVIASECTGCDLCVEPCPVDCIDMLTVPAHTGQHRELPHRSSSHIPLLQTYRARKVELVVRQQEQQRNAYRKQRFENRRQRLARDAMQRRGSRRRSVARPENPDVSDHSLQSFSRQQAKIDIADAVARVKARKQKTSNAGQSDPGKDAQ